FCSMKISQEVRDFASKQNQSADSFLASAQAGADAAEASRAAAIAGMEEMSKLYKAKGEQLYLPEEETE
ncbi:MAG: phosphomethylpyrimidine synthase ThiC, partial [Alteraurantiacibacter sp. bin_em_oilr2.035]|nr:phosphomethylpyrimidine synthase ThiC [Alteraurantiacibacter sp. bin_em_oilr2.035]